MRYIVQATRVHIEHDIGSMDWARTEQLPTFWVEAVSSENAENIAAAVIGPADEVHINVTTFDG